MNIPEGVGHASLVSQEGCEVDGLAGFIFRPRTHPPNVRLASLVGQKPHDARGVVHGICDETRENISQRATRTCHKHTAGAVCMMSRCVTIPLSSITLKIHVLLILYSVMLYEVWSHFLVFFTYSDSFSVPRGCHHARHSNNIMQSTLHSLQICGLSRQDLCLYLISRSH